ncbi:ABC transporter ATP-binding protein [Phosphitispora fastidiosa]|uniref:ABC transporter ATP-binding protein n=1 Tax=Phosphitispora fastidiosa TaxID=2837202 RepID=UPI001E2C8098|nr:ABC transporter ATP-binding protein [Phosphitispora fastidiosa]MBU7006169.1 putative ABC transport system ATP-binding protein [Phosphitispora fastidiosa]
MIKLVDISKFYHTGSVTLAALDKVNLEIKNGEIIAIIGPSGSGKSTLMNMIGCLDVPSQGQYLLDEKEVSKLKEDDLSEIRNKKIGFIFQSFNLLPKLTALENVELPLIYRGMSTAERRQSSVEALDLVGLSDRMHHKPTELSGGQQQRVAIARALAGNPPVILADEPTGNLDSRSGVEVMEIIGDLNKKGKTVIIITHDMEIARQARRIIRIQDGRIVNDEEVA